LKKIRDYFYKNRVYIQKKARKLIIDSLLGVIHEPTPLKWPADDPADDPANDLADDPTDNPTDDPTDDSADNPTNNPTNNPTLALLLLLTAPI
jgi:hypothetical protein